MMTSSQTTILIELAFLAVAGTLVLMRQQQLHRQLRTIPIPLKNRNEHLMRLMQEHDPTRRDAR